MTTTTQKIVAVFGVVFLLVGIAGLLTPSGAGMHTGKQLEEFPRLLGLFPVNLAHNLVHLLFGVAGLAAARSFNGAVQYARIGGVIYLVLAILGFVAPTTFGFIPIGGNDIWLHALLGITLLAVGYTARPAAAATAA